MSGRVVLFVQRGGFEAAFGAASVAVTAAAMGDEVHVVMAFDALRAFVKGRFGSVDLGRSSEDRESHARAEALGVLPPAKMLEEARALGARVVACDTTVRLCGLDESSAAPALDEILGLASIWRLTEGARVLSF